jgi:hypothetical protein
MARFILILLCVLLISGCSKEYPTILSDDPAVETVENMPYTMNAVFGERSGTYTGEVLNGIPYGQGIFSSVNSEGIAWIYEGSFVNGHFEGYGKTTWDDGLVNEGTYRADLLNGFGKAYRDGILLYEGEFINGVSVDDLIPIVSSETDFPLLDSSPSPEIVEELYLDFFSDEERQIRYTELYQSYNYAELLEYLYTYIEENSPLVDDSAYTILSLIEPALDYQDSWIISLDEFDNEYTLTFKGANEITQSRAISVSLKGTDLVTKIGFRKNGWLFFDAISISADGHRIYGASIRGSITRNVISGNSIEEYCFTSLYDDVVIKVKESDKSIIRFENDKSGEKYDHVLTREEKDALYCGMILQDNNRELSNLLSRYKRG